MYNGGDGQDLVGMIQAIVQNELARMKIAEIGVVTELFSHESGSDKNNYQCNVRLRDTGLELQKVPVATGRIGLAAIPDIDDLVLVQFVGGNIHGAVVTGRLYNDVDRPPEAAEKEWVYVSPHEAESDVRRLYLEFPNGNTVHIDDDKVHIEAGKTVLTLNNNGDVELTAEGNVKVESKSATTITSGGDMNLEAGGALNMKAKTDVTMEGLSIAIKGQTSTQVEGQASATVKGAMVTISGMTSFSMG